MENVEKQITEDILKLKSLESSDAWKDFCSKKKVEIEAIKEILDREPSVIDKLSNCTYHRKSAQVFEKIKADVELSLGKMPGADLLVKQIAGVALMCRRSSYTDVGGEVEGNTCTVDIDKKRLVALCDLIGDDAISSSQKSLPANLIDNLEKAFQQAEEETLTAEIVEME